MQLLAAVVALALVVAANAGTLYRARYPLVGGPAFLKLHVAVLYESESKLTQFDFLPINPTALTTAAKLLTLQRTEGVCRERELKFRPRGIEKIGETRATLDDLRGYTREHDTALHLIENSCSTYADRLLQVFVIADELC